MPAQQPIVINDGQTTPVAKTFSNAGVKPGESNLATFVDRSSGQALGFARLSISLREPLPAKTGSSSTSARMYKAIVTLAIPTLEALGTSDSGLTPPPTLAYQTAFRGEFMIPERASLQNRKDLLAFVKNLMANASLTSVIHDLEPIW